MRARRSALKGEESGGGRECIGANGQPERGERAIVLVPSGGGLPKVNAHASAGQAMRAEPKIGGAGAHAGARLENIVNHRRRCRR